MLWSIVENEFGNIMFNNSGIKPNSFDEFILAFFLSSHDQTLPLYMWGQLRFPKKLPHVLALGAVIIVATSIIVMLSYWLRNLGSPSDKKSNIGGI